MAKSKPAGAATKDIAVSDAFKSFFVDELKDIYWAEKHLTKALPKMQKAATSKELAKSFADHLVVTNKQVNRLEQIFTLLDQKAVAKKCEAMAGLVKEGAGIIEDTDKGTYMRDVGLVLAAQKIEHYEIATYGGLAQLARVMGNEKVAALLKETLIEEKNADDMLTELAESGINEAATMEGMKGEMKTAARGKTLSKKVTKKVATG
jgi:ferritin-like metal-binding protein YciE